MWSILLYIPKFAYSLLNPLTALILSRYSAWMSPVFFNSRAEPACLVYLGVEQTHNQAHPDNLIQQATCAFSYFHI